MKNRSLIVPALTLTSILLTAGGESGAALQVPDGSPSQKSSSYIVQLAESPAVAYEGDVLGLPATRPALGLKLNPNSPSVKGYVAYLHNRHDAVLIGAGVPLGAKLYDYDYSFNGFAAVLSSAEAARLRSLPGVLGVEPDVLRQVQTDNTPSFLGVDAVWEQLGGQSAAGEDVIIGIIDTGIWPEHPSFSDQADLADRPGQSGKRNRVYDAPSNWFGVCQKGERWSSDDCNNKLIGARYFLAGFARFGIVQEEYTSARDADGHGTHTASTAGGNAGVDPSIGGNNLGVGTLSGMAPRARIAAYKACWNGEGCALTDLVAAIDAAVADGVDVINYSIASDTPELLSADGIAFLDAADAGVFVSVPAGDTGPLPGTVGSPAALPWLIASGASTHSRVFTADVILGNSAVYSGASVTGATPVAPLVDADDAGSELCVVGELDPAVVAGKIVLCLRGDAPPLEQSREVAAAGGVGMVLYNAAAGQELTTDNHFVPTVHLTFADGLAVKDYIAITGGSATAGLTAGTAEADPTAPVMAAFSSRGPNGASADVIKPDLTAPGVFILAGNTPTPLLGAQGQLFQSRNGTSMSSAHVAGIGALLVQAHPGWTPAMIRSALMTTAGQDVVKEDGATAADPFDFGGGHIQPLPAMDPGLVYDAGFDEYHDFLCGAGALSGCTASEMVDPSDLNLPSIGIGELTGLQTVVRVVTDVGPDATYAVSIEAPPGVDVDVSPAELVLMEGESASYEVTFTTTDTATFDVWAFGSLTWSDGNGHSVRSPIAVRPVALAFPAEFRGTGATGSGSWQVQFGYSGDFFVSVHGLDAATTTAATVADDPANDIDTALESGVGVILHEIPVPAGTLHLRTALFDEATDGDDDLDLYLFDPDDDFVGRSTGATSAEVIDVPNPAEGTWTLVVHGRQTDGPSANYTLFTWTLGSGDDGNLTATDPGGAVFGTTATIDVSWTGLTPGLRYLGAVSYDAGGSEIGRTLIDIRP